MTAKETGERPLSPLTVRQADMADIVVDKKKRKKKDYLFTSRQQSVKAIIAVILGLISQSASGAMIYLTYRDGGQAQLRYAAVVFLCMIFAVIGLVLSLLSRKEPDKWYLMSYLGIELNGAELILCSAVIYLGVL